MKLLTVREIAERWHISERTVRNYCSCGRIPGAVQSGRAWRIPDDAVFPARSNAHTELPRDLLGFLRMEKDGNVRGGIYHKVQIELTYNSNHMEGSRLTHDQTRSIFETHTIDTNGVVIDTDDIVETANHFRCIDYIIDKANSVPSESMLKHLHGILKNGTSDSRKGWFAVGDYKKLPNEVGDHATARPEEVPVRMREMLRIYNESKRKTLEEIIAFHYDFESIHPFQDGNGRIGRLIMFKECLRNGIVPFIIDDDLKMFYYRGLHEWKSERGYLRDTCLRAQDRFKAWLDYFRIPYESIE